MRRALLAPVLALLPLLSGCIMPVVTSWEPFYPADSTGLFVDGLANKWISADDRLLTIRQDTYTGNPGDYVFILSAPFIPEPGSDSERADVPLDGEPGRQYYGHVFERNGQVYCDFILGTHLKEPGSDEPGKIRREHMPPLGPGQTGGHMLCRMELGLGKIGFQLMDVEWVAEYLAPTGPHANELKLFRGAWEPGGPEQVVPLINDTFENTWAFIDRHAKDGLWGPQVTFNKAMKSQH
jgi:hypothetical protein